MRQLITIMGCVPVIENRSKENINKRVLAMYMVTLKCEYIYTYIHICIWWSKYTLPNLVGQGNHCILSHHMKVYKP